MSSWSDGNLERVGIVTTMVKEKSGLDAQTKNLVAIGAAAAVNCRPCLEHHVPHGLAAGLTEADVRMAIEIGFGVNRGAHAKTQGYIDDVISDSADADLEAPCCDAETAAATGCC